MKKDKITKVLLSPYLSQNVAQTVLGLQIVFGGIVNIIDAFTEEDCDIPAIAPQKSNKAIAPKKSKKEWQDD